MNIYPAYPYVYNEDDLLVGSRRCFAILAEEREVVYYSKLLRRRMIVRPGQRERWLLRKMEAQTYLEGLAPSRGVVNQDALEGLN